MGGNWKTTVLGVLTVLLALCGAAKAMLTGVSIDYPTVMAAIMAGVGLIHAKDASNTTPPAGA